MRDVVAVFKIHCRRLKIASLAKGNTVLACAFVCNQEKTVGGHGLSNEWHDAFNHAGTASSVTNHDVGE